MADRKVELIKGRIEFDDGQVCEFQISDDGSSRWGNTTDVLADAVDVCDAMTSGLREEYLFVTDNGIPTD